MEQLFSHICRLCLSTNSEKNNRMLNGNILAMLNVLLPKSEFNVVDPYICHTCISNLEMSYNFKLKCIDNKDKIKNYITQSNHSVLISRLQNVKIESMCCICFITDCNFNKIGLLTKYFCLCIPELAVQISNDVLVCHSCYETVESSYSFISMCLEVEEKIKQFVITNRVNEVKLWDMVNVLEGSKTESKENNQEFETHFVQEFKVDNTSIKVEINDAIRTDNVEQDKDGRELESTNVNNKIDSREQIKTELIENISQQFEPHYLGELSRDVCVNTELSNNEVPSTLQPDIIPIDVPQKTFPCKKCDFMALSKNELKYHFITHRKNCKMYECEVCPFITRHKNVIDNHNLTHMSDEQVTWYNCDKCTFRTRLQGNLDKHKFTHNKQSDELKKYKCEECAYKTMWKRDLERHRVKHQKFAFACDQCNFSTKHERYLKEHIYRVHSVKEELPEETFYCAQCNFSTKHKRSLIPHMVTHKNEEQLKWYSCSFCSYRAKWKRSITTHELIHVEKYKCDQCEFQTTLKRFLKEHLRGHLPIPLYTCSYCDFSSHYKQAVTQHSIKHKSPDEIKVYQCPHCQYSSKRPTDLKQHVTLLHAEDTEELKCSACFYVTKCKKRLKNHVKMMHTESDKITKFKCTSCPFETKYKSSLLNHQQIHNSDDSPSIECPDCDYKTKRKDLLLKHFLVHKSCSEVEMFQCYNCNYKSKYKRALIKHMDGHKDPSLRKQPLRLKCDKCDYETKWKYSMKKHLETKHVGEFEQIKMEIDVSKTEIECRDEGEGDSNIGFEVKDS